MQALLLNHYLTDTDIANFARQSFADLAANYTQAQNDNLVRYLARGVPGKEWDILVEKIMNGVADKSEAHQLAVYLRSIPEHWVPFGHPHITIRMRAPIPIKVQCFKHKIGFVESEESRRYISTTPELFVPKTMRAAAANVKQGSAGAHSNGDYWKYRYQKQANEAIELYELMIKEGVAAEQARFVLPQGCEAQWAWTGSLYAWAKAYVKRIDSHAQGEIQDLFKEIGSIIEPLFPVSWPALTRGQY